MTQEVSRSAHARTRITDDDVLKQIPVHQARYQHILGCVPSCACTTLGKLEEREVRRVLENARVGHRSRLSCLPCEFVTEHQGLTVSL